MDHHCSYINSCFLVGYAGRYVSRYFSRQSIFCILQLFRCMLIIITVGKKISITGMAVFASGCIFLFFMQLKKRKVTLERNQSGPKLRQYTNWWLNYYKKCTQNQRKKEMHFFSYTFISIFFFELQT